ncbi:hypothetical protein [Kocuria rhizosphaericola]
MNSFDFVITVAIGATFGRVLTARSIPLLEAVTAFALLVRPAVRRVLPAAALPPVLPDGHGRTDPAAPPGRGAARRPAS